MNRKLLFIYNPFSGKGEIKQNLSDITDIFIKHGFDVSIHTTQGKGDATKKVLETAKEFDRIVCSGGDGTLNEVVKGLIKSKAQTPLGYIPTGSTNDFGCSLGIAKDVIEATKIAAGSNEHCIDMGCFNDDHFVYVAAFGIFTRASYQTDQNLKNFLGHAAYIFEAIKSLQDIPSIPMQIEVDGNIIRGNFIYGMVTNAIQVGGLKDFIKGDVELDDGLFEVMLIKSPQNPVELAEIGSYLANLKKSSEYVYNFQTKSIKFTAASQVAWTLDGEYGGNVEVANVSSMSSAIHMMTKGDKPRVI